MPNKSRNKKPQQTTQEPQSTVSDMADTARKNYQQAFRTGQRMQEELGQAWTRMLNHTSNVADWQKQWSHFATTPASTIPLAQRQMECVLELMEKNGRTSAELLKKAVDAAQAQAVSESQAKWTDFWTASMRAAQSNVEAVTEIGTKAIDSWVDFIRRNTELAERRAARAA